MEVRNIKICDINAGALVKGYDFSIFGVSDCENPISNTIIYVKNGFNYSNKITNSIIVTKDKVDVDESCIQVISDNPKNAYAEMLIKLQSLLPAAESIYNNGSFISETACIGKNSKIGRFCIIEDDVQIGENCEIGDYVYIGAHSRIKNKVVIKQKCCIGVSDADIYGMNGQCMTLPHLGGTIIEDGCLLLEGAQIAAGDTQATVMSYGSMLGIAASLGHNSIIGKETLIGAHVCICGHCEIGDNVYAAPASTVTNRLKIGDRAKIGIGSVVLQSVEADAKVFGNPAMSYWKK